MQKLVTKFARSTLLAAGIMMIPVAATAQLDQAIDTGRASTADGARVQSQIDNLDTRVDDLAAQYRAVLQEIESVKLNVDQQEVFLRSQRNELSSMDEQLGRVEIVKTQLGPLLDEMYNWLADFVRSDAPFELEDRLGSLEEVQSAKDDPDQTRAEFYRLLVTVFENELAYGRSRGYEDGQILVNDEEYQGQIVRIGRVSVLFVNDKKMFIWDRNAAQEGNGWRELDEKFRVDVERASRIIRDERPPELFGFPMHGPTASDAE